ncbi:MAG TPA: histidine phosphatase family protein [Gemmatimonadaceae bacterium]|jgi:phosphohistidine phosphatase
MKLVIVRHADAGDRDEWEKTGEPDELRPLSDKGRKQMKSAADGLRALVPKCDVVVTSPYTRAVQTAEIVSEVYDAPVEETSALEPESAPDDFVHWLRERGDVDVVIVAGHEPHLGGLATWLMTGASESHVEFKKGGACLLEFEGQVKKGDGVLRWLMGPKELAELA